MKSMILAFGLLLFSANSFASPTEIQCELDSTKRDYSLTGFKIELGLENDVFTTDDGTVNKLTPIEGSRLKWKLLSINKYSMYFDLETGLVKTYKGDVLLDTHPFVCTNVEEALFHENSMILTPGKLEAAGMQPFEKNISDVARYGLDYVSQTIDLEGIANGQSVSK